MEINSRRPDKEAPIKIKITFCAPLQRSRGNTNHKRTMTQTAWRAEAREFHSSPQEGSTIKFQMLLSSPTRWQHLPVSMHRHCGMKFEMESRNCTRTAKTLWDRKLVSYIVYDKNPQRLKQFFFLSLSLLLHAATTNHNKDLYLRSRVPDYLQTGHAPTQRNWAVTVITAIGSAWPIYRCPLDCGHTHPLFPYTLLGHGPVKVTAAITGSLPVDQTIISFAHCRAKTSSIGLQLSWFCANCDPILNWNWLAPLVTGYSISSICLFIHNEK